MKVEGEHKETYAAEVASDLLLAKDVVVVPGYGLAAAKGQYAFYEIATK